MKYMKCVIVCIYRLATSQHLPKTIRAWVRTHTQFLKHIGLN